MSEPTERATSSTRRSNSTLVALVTSSGYRATSLTDLGAGRAAARPFGHLPHRHGRPRRRRSRPRRDLPRSGRWCARNPWCRPRMTRMPAPRSRPEVTCSMRPSSRRDGGVALVLDVDLCEVGTGSQCGAQRTFDDVVIDHVAQPRWAARRAPTGARRRPWPRAGRARSMTQRLRNPVITPSRGSGDRKR